MAYKSYQYKLRSSGPMSFDAGDMITHTFMAEEQEVRTYEATACFLTSQDMSGQFKDDGSVGEFSSANYSALQFTANGSNGPIMMFQGTEIKKPSFISEESIGRGIPEIIA